MASDSEGSWTGSEDSDDDRYEEEDVRGVLIEKMEEHDPNIFSINFDDLEGLWDSFVFFDFFFFFFFSFFFM